MTGRYARLAVPPASVTTVPTLVHVERSVERSTVTDRPRSGAATGEPEVAASVTRRVAGPPHEIAAAEAEIAADGEGAASAATTSKAADVAGGSDPTVASRVARPVAPAIAQPLNVATPPTAARVGPPSQVNVAPAPPLASARVTVEVEAGPEVNGWPP